MIRLANRRQYDGVLVEPGDVREDQIQYSAASGWCEYNLFHTLAAQGSNNGPVEVSANRYSTVRMTRLEGGHCVCNVVHQLTLVGSLSRMVDSSYL